MKNHYKTLGISYNATAAEIKKAYKHLALIYHPDVNKSSDAAAKFIEINEAYETLIDKVKRAAYDKEFLSPPIIPKQSYRKQKPYIRHTDIPYAEGVLGTDAEPTIQNNIPKNDSFSLWRFIGLILLVILAHLFNSRR